MNCEHCEKEFSTKSSLSYHQKTAKYCLEKQGKSNEQYKCSHCEKCFTTLQRLNEHQKQSCKLKDKVNYDQEINRIKDEFGTYKIVNREVFSHANFNSGRFQCAS